MSVEKLLITQEQKPFTTHLNIVLQNLNNAEALGVWCYLSSLPPDWVVSKEQLRNHFGIGRDKLDKIITHLRKKNLLIVQGIKDINGKFTHWSIHVLSGTEFIKDSQSTEKPYTGSQYTEKPPTGKPHQWKTATTKEIKKKENKEQQKEILVLPEWLDRNDWDDYKQHRKDIKKPLNKSAENRALAKLTRMKKAGHDVRDILNESIINGWSGLFEPKRQSNGMVRSEIRSTVPWYNPNHV